MVKKIKEAQVFQIGDTVAIKKEGVITDIESDGFTGKLQYRVEFGEVGKTLGSAYMVKEGIELKQMVEGDKVE